VVSTEGSWQAGVKGANAGIFMPAHPQVGQVFKQEDANQKVPGGAGRSVG
jgi:hypothetical protein